MVPSFAVCALFGLVVRFDNMFKGKCAIIPISSKAGYMIKGCAFKSGFIQRRRCRIFQACLSQKKINGPQNNLIGRKREKRMYKVIVVDDEAIIVNGLVRILPWEQYNCSVVATANDGHEALELIHKHTPDILYTDIKMPRIDGLALIAAVRSEYPQMEICILSGYPDFEYAQRAIELGVAKYILKPSRLAELEQALDLMTKRLQKTSPIKSAEETPVAESEEKAGNFILSNAIKYIETHYAEKLTLSDVAEQVYVSQWHLSKLISKNANQSFSDILNGARITKAKELLRDPSMKIWEVSEAVGFADVTHFSRIFKKIENMSANEYRNRSAK